MSKKKKLTKDEIISIYMDFLLEAKKQPSSITEFSKEVKILKSSFTNHFESIQEIEQAIFEAFFTHTINHLAVSDEYHQYESRNKLLSFYYTFFEIVAANKEYVQLIFSLVESNFARLKMLTLLRANFLNYIKNLGIETINFNIENVENFQQKAIAEIVWFQFVYTFKFWLEDTSIEKEKTDVLIEKAVNTTFDVLDTTAIKSLLDLGKFLFKEKFNF